MATQLTSNGTPLWTPTKTQELLLTCPIEDVFFGGARGGGKLSPVYSEVCTPFGFKKIGELSVGDMVTDPTTGGHCRVIGVFPQGVKDIYRVTTDDGGECLVGLEHLWAYKLPNHPRPRTKDSPERNYAEAELGATTPDERWNNLRVGTTETLAEALANGYNPRIPLTEPVLFSTYGRTGRGDVTGYLAGVLLGDGYIESLTVTSCDDEVRDYLVSVGFVPGKEMHSDGKPKDWRAKGDIRVKLRQWVANHGLTGKRAWEKFIPDYVFTAHIDYRLEFLRGLMDTDGYVDERGHCSFCSTSRDLAEGVQKLVWSLGGKAKIREKHPTYTYLGEKRDGRLAYDVSIWMRKTSSLFKIERKRARCTDSWNGGHELMREIRSIEKVGEADAVCIQVDTVYGLYVTDSYIVTHNSDGLLVDFVRHWHTNRGYARGLFFRKSYPELAELWSRAMELYPRVGAESNKTEMMFTWPDGAKIEFRYLESDDDAARYQGRNVTWQGFDELGNFTSFAPIDKLYATLRSAHGVKCERRSAGNPGGPLTAGIRERYIEPSPPGRPFKWAPNKLRPDLQIESVFIPSKLDDNIYLLKNDPGYEARLAAAAADPMLYRAWREGRWDGLFGQFFLNFDPHSDRCVIQPRPLSPWYTRWIGIDFGYAHDAAVTWGCYDGSVVYVYREFKAKELTPAELCRIIVQLTGRDEHIDSVFLSPDASQRRSSPKTIEQEIRGNLPWPVRHADNDRIGGWVLLNQMFQRGTLKLFSECRDLIKWLTVAQRDPKRPEDVLKHDGDDLGDSLRYLIKTSDIIPRTPPEVLYEQRILPHIQAGNGMKALIERFKLDEELRKGGKPISPRGKRRR